MTTGTSPPPRGTLSALQAGVALGIERVTARWRGSISRASLDVPRLARVAAGLHLGGVGIIMITAWHPAIAGPGTMSGMAGLHLAFLMMTEPRLRFSLWLATGAHRRSKTPPFPRPPGQPS
jgi:hypothetical protein